MLLIWVAGAFLVGIVAGSGAGLVAAPSVAACLLLTVAGVWRSTRMAAPLVVLAFLLFGVGRAGYRPPSSGLDLTQFAGRTLQVQGTVSEEPDIRDSGGNYVISAQSAVVSGKKLMVTGKIALHTPRAETLDYGEIVALSGRLALPVNSASLPYRDVLARRGITTVMRFPRVVSGGEADTGWMGLIVRLREHLEAGINEWLPEPEAALLIAITLGARSASLGDLAPLLVSTGLIHIIAISGIKVALVAGMFYALAARLGRREIVLATSLVALWAYVMLTGSTVSGVRSAIMWSLIFLATYLGRNTVAIVSLAVTAAVMVALDPSLPWDPAFLLSTVGTFAIVAFTSPILARLSRVPSPFREAFAVSLAAQIGTLPIVIVSFHIVSLSGPIANALVLPALPLLIALGFLVGAFAMWPVLDSLLAVLAYAVLHLTVLLVTWLAALPGEISVRLASGELATVYYVALGVLAVRVLRRAGWVPVARWHRAGREMFLALGVAASLVTVSLTQARNDPGPHLFWLGSGNSFVAQVDNHVVLIDGSGRPYQLLERLEHVMPWDRRTIDLIVVTDPRATNVAGLDAVLQHYDVAAVLDVGVEYPSSTYAAWRADVRRRHIPAYALRTGASVTVGRARITAIDPDNLTARPQDGIGMIRLSFRGRTVLFAGAASRTEQLEAVFRPVRLAADILLVDGNSGCDPAFVRHVSARVTYAHSAVCASRRFARLGGSTEIPLSTP